MKIPFFIVGATARDILLEVHYGIGSKRATLDIDIAVFIENWEQFNHLKDELIGIKHFTPTRDIHRLLFQKRLPVDIVPFGGVAEKDDLVEWPPAGSIKMSVTGFRECFQHALQVKISDKPKLSVSNQGLDVVNDGALGHGAMFELFFIKIANLRFHSQLKRIPIFLLTFPFPDSNLTPMDFRQKNTFKNSLGNWWWPNSHPEASLPR